MTDQSNRREGSGLAGIVIAVLFAAVISGASLFFWETSPTPLAQYMRPVAAAQK